MTAKYKCVVLRILLHRFFSCAPKFKCHTVSLRISRRQNVVAAARNPTRDLCLAVKCCSLRTSPAALLCKLIYF